METIRKLDFRKAKKVEGGLFIPYRTPPKIYKRSPAAMERLNKRAEEATEIVKTYCEYLDINYDSLRSKSSNKYVNIKKAITALEKDIKPEALAIAFNNNRTAITYYRKQVLFNDVKDIIRKLKYERARRS